jgi:hypothetical protein
VGVAAARVGALVGAVVDSSVAGTDVTDPARVAVLDATALPEDGGEDGADALALGDADTALVDGSSSPPEQAASTTARHATARATTRVKRMFPAIE